MIEVGFGLKIYELCSGRVGLSEGGRGGYMICLTVFSLFDFHLSFCIFFLNSLLLLFLLLLLTAPPTIPFSTGLRV